MHHPEIPVGPPCSEIFVARTNDVIRFRPQKIILTPFRKILAVLPVIGPIVNSAVVPHDHRSGINEFQIVRRRNARIGPTVIRLRNARVIMPHGIRLKPHSIGRQPNIDTPGRPRQQIEHPDDTARTAVRIFAGQIIHGIRSRRAVSHHSVIKLDTSARPGTAQGNIAELDYVVVINIRETRRFVRSAPHFASDFRHNGDSHIIILQHHDIPCSVFRPVRESVIPKIRIYLSPYSYRIRV